MVFVAGVLAGLVLIAGLAVAGAYVITRFAIRAEMKRNDEPPPDERSRPG